MKRDYYPPAIGSLISAFLGFMCFLLLAFTSIGSFDILLYTYLFFFVLSIIFGGYSLMLKNNKPGWIGLVSGFIFIFLFLIILYLFRDVDFI